MKKILVVDDESALREAISQLLKEKGYGVATASNGKEGLKEFARFRPDLVLTDISMPDMEGIEFLRILRKQKSDLPIIVMSGNIIGAKFLKSASLFGATTTLKKPFSNRDLIDIIEASL